MVRIDTLRTSFLALVVPAFALATVACGGGNGGNDPYTSGVDPSAQQSDNAAASARGGDRDATTDEQPNAVADGTEGDDKGYQAALGQDGAPLARRQHADDPGTTTASAAAALPSARARTALVLERGASRVQHLNKSTSYYSHTTYMNESTGTRRTDCSGFVGYALNRVARRRLREGAAPEHVQAARGRLVQLPLDPLHDRLDPDHARAGAASPARLILKPGDVIAWLQPPSVSSENTGHVMVVNSVARNGRTERGPRRRHRLDHGSRTRTTAAAPRTPASAPAPSASRSIRAARRRRTTGAVASATTRCRRRSRSAASSDRAGPRDERPLSPRAVASCRSWLSTLPPSR